MVQIAQQRILQYVQERVGLPELAKRLDVDPGVLESWIRGDVKMPQPALSALADLVDDLYRN
jgi:hypothetical protein